MHKFQAVFEPKHLGGGDEEVLEVMRKKLFWFFLGVTDFDIVVEIQKGFLS